MSAARDFLAALGIRLKSYRDGGHNTTCPRCSAARKPEHRKEPCLYVRVDGDGCGFRCFNCGWTGGTKGGERAEPHLEQRRDYDADRTALALSIWREAREAHGTTVERYLAGRRLALPPHAGEVIRFHPACPFKLQRVPTMVALLRDIATDEPCGIHRTALLADGSDRDRALGKAMLGRCAGAAVKLSPNDDVSMGLGLSEGIETGLAVLGIGWAPIWAAGSTSGIASFPVLPLELTIFADRDANGAGQRAAELCARRWAEATRGVTIRMPSITGADWADARAA